MHDENTLDKNVLCYCIAGLLLAALILFSLLTSSSNSCRFYVDMASKGYAECPRVGSSETDWMPASACPTYKGVNP